MGRPRDRRRRGVGPRRQRPVVGGTDGGSALAELEGYDPATDEWTRNAPMPTPRFRLAAVSWGGKLYAIGGVSLSAGAPPPLPMDDPPTGTGSTAAPPLPAPRVPRRYFALAETGGTLYIVGGTHGWMCGNAASIEALEIAPRLQFAWDLNHLVG